MTNWSKIKQEAWEFIKFGLMALAIVIPIRMFIAQPFIVSGSSMVPTFHDKEYLIIDQLTYNIISEPKRDDVIVFHYPADEKKYFIKRIIGLPNETVILDEDTIKIKNKDNPEGFVVEEPFIAEEYNKGKINEYVLGDEEYFVMGDNRNYSSDSRAWGTLPRKLIVGRAFLRLLPLSKIDYLPGSINK